MISRSLTVGNSVDFLKAGGMICFERVGDRLTFSVNVTHMKEAGVMVSSKLLAIARKVEGKDKSGASLDLSLPQSVYSHQGPIAPVKP